MDVSTVILCNTLLLCSMILTMEPVKSNELSGIGNNLQASYSIVVLADLDKKSKLATAKTMTFKSFLQHAQLKRSKLSKNNIASFSVKWEKGETFYTKMNEGGRGFELSELKWFNGKLLSFDDRTGIVYDLKNFNSSGRSSLKIKAIPRQIVMQGDGEEEKGQKNEWATIKNNELYIGSHGTLRFDKSGGIRKHLFWVAIMSISGVIRHVNWEKNYMKIKKALGCPEPGYVVHEAIEWSSIHKKWFILPRKISKDKFNPKLDELKGSNKILIASEDFSAIDVMTVGVLTPERGFSSFKFVPGSGDTIIAAIKITENEESNTQASFITVFDIKGNTLMKETKIPGEIKYEGIAFLLKSKSNIFKSSSSSASWSVFMVLFMILKYAVLVADL